MYIFATLHLTGPFKYYTLPKYNVAKFIIAEQNSTTTGF